MSSTLLPPDAAGIGDAFAASFAVIRDQLDALVDTTTWSLDEAGLGSRLTEVLAIRAQVEEVTARLVAETEHRDLPHRHGASSTTAHLMATHRLSARAAAQMVSTARRLHAASGLTESTRVAVATGRLSAEQGVVVADAIHRLGPSTDPARLAAAHIDLLRHAQTLPYAQLRIAANHLVEVVDPDGADQILETQLRDQERRALASASLVGQYGPDGITRGRFTLPNLTFAMLKKHLEALTAPRRSTTNGSGDTGTGVNAAGTGRVGDVETGIGQLPYATRMGQAFCELIDHLPTEGHPQHGVANATIVVTLDHDTLQAGVGAALLDTGGPISISQTRRLACNAALIPAVLGADSQVLDLGRTRRLFDRHQRLALATHDRGCIFPGCQRPPAWCEAHHRTPWTRNGPTDLTNGCLLCSFHHHLIHQGEWHLTLAPDGITDVIPPTRIDPHQHPLRHQRFKPRPP